MKKRIFSGSRRLIMAVAAIVTMPAWNNAWAQTLRIAPLANDNFLIRVSPETKEKFLLLPIEEAAPESQVRVVADNAQQRLLNIRMALTKVDYYLPFSLDEFRGMELSLYSHINIDRSNRGGVGSEIWRNHIGLSDTFDTTNREKFRPTYHHAPEYAWMNDPNGMFYKDGVWHLYYQYNPYGSMWGNMHWGHSTSRDLINWDHHPIALKQDMHGAIFSGSCIVDHNNTAGFGNDAVIAMYTASTQTPWGYDLQTQHIAYSTDGGYTFHKYEGNPVLTADIPDFRDPNMFWMEETQRWILVMSAGQEMRIYSSPDMMDWTEESRFGKGLGCHDGVWECPDLMKLPLPGSKGSKWVLICNINPGGPSGGSATQYFIGDFDGHRFTVDNAGRYEDGKSLWQDYGKDHYATVSFSDAPDRRHTMIGWMSNWQYANVVPTMQYRSANTICREPYLYKGSDRLLYLGSRPSPEYTGKGLDREVKIKGSCSVILSNAQGEEFRLIYDEKAMTLTADRSCSGEKAFSQDFDVKAVAPVRNRITGMRIFIDNSSVEVFANNGEVVITSLVFPKSRYNNIRIEK